jgi:hypothetical protein
MKTSYMACFLCETIKHERITVIFSKNIYFLLLLFYRPPKISFQFVALMRILFLCLYLADLFCEADSRNLIIPFHRGRLTIFFKVL